MIKIALSKGRIFKETLPLLAAADIVPAEDPETSRKLILATNHADIKLMIIRATDVPTYVQFGAADLGVAGKDVLLEHGGEGLYEPIDLKIAKCRLMTAGLKNAKPANGRAPRGWADSMPWGSCPGPPPRPLAAMPRLLTASRTCLPP